MTYYRVFHKSTEIESKTKEDTGAPHLRVYVAYIKRFTVQKVRKKDTYHDNLPIRRPQEEHPEGGCRYHRVTFPKLFCLSNIGLKIIPGLTSA